MGNKEDMLEAISKSHGFGSPTPSMFEMKISKDMIYILYFSYNFFNIYIYILPAFYYTTAIAKLYYAMKSIGVDHIEMDSDNM